MLQVSFHAAAIDIQALKANEVKVLSSLTIVFNILPQFMLSENLYKYIHETTFYSFVSSNRHVILYSDEKFENPSQYINFYR